MRPFIFALGVLVLTDVGRAQEPKAAPRRVFVLHSGIHTVIANPEINISAQRLEAGLKKRGVESRDIIVMTNPFPKASWSNPFPREAVALYRDAFSPTSKICEDAYLRMDRTLKERKVGPDDEVIWIGHSAGGQLGMTVTHIAHNLGKYPLLAKRANRYRITMVVTLGTPIGANLLSEDVRLRNYFSTDDNVVRLATATPFFSSLAGVKTRLEPCTPTLCPAWKVRVFNGIEHSEWTKEDRIIDRILAELGPGQCPAWHSALCSRPGLCLSQMLSRALSETCHISLEDPPGTRK